MLDFNLLKAFDAPLDERNVTRAAARFALTQPAVSGMATRLLESSAPRFMRMQRVRRADAARARARGLRQARACSARSTQCCAPPLAIPGFDKVAVRHERALRDPAHARLLQTCGTKGKPAARRKRVG
ncbi:hypothetical protein WS72_23940 [Burkholderia savannae]|uniref:HTH lysR-type domain-containing protein n=1 Tax=Burkholderia savannae TaxID=1637837 RepID=A0ABR5T429_9BURK|nr:hypothetical protein WS72_23940 [Burkholderia savannae]KWZ47998.1 hypothetical protein WS73_05550 [Burkholderia savannae]